MNQVHHGYGDKLQEGKNKVVCGKLKLSDGIL